MIDPHEILIEFTAYDNVLVDEDITFSVEILNLRLSNVVIPTLRNGIIKELISEDEIKKLMKCMTTLLQEYK
jgi:hypothetical protein